MKTEKYNRAQLEDLVLQMMETELGGEKIYRAAIGAAKNPDLRASLAAMLRAAESARQTALQTGTAIVVVRDGKPVRITADELRKEQRP